MLTITLLAGSCGGGDGPSDSDPRWHDAEPAASPDGRHIAFIRGKGHFALHVIDLRTRQVRRLAPPATRVSDRHPIWSPDGKSIVFVRNEELYTIDADGSHLKRLTHNSKPDLWPAWSPDGSLVAFWRFPTVRVIDVDGRRERQLDAVGARPAWSPDGLRVAVGSSSGGLQVVRVEGGRQQTIYRGAVGGGAPAGIAWSPDGSKIVFRHIGDLYVIRPDGTGMRQLTDGASEYEADENPVWSPKGDLIAFVRVNSSLTNGDASSGVHGLYVIGADGDEMRRLPVPIEEGSLSYTWSADGRQLILGGNQAEFVRVVAATPQTLLLINADGSGLETLTQAPQSRSRPPESG